LVSRRHWLAGIAGPPEIVQTGVFLVSPLFGGIAGAVRIVEARITASNLPVIEQIERLDYASGENA